MVSSFVRLFFALTPLGALKRGRCPRASKKSLCDDVLTREDDVDETTLAYERSWDLLPGQVLAYLPLTGPHEKVYA